MTYLFGDSTPSLLRVNFIELLRDALDFAVQVAQAADRLDQGRERLRARKQAAEVELQRIEAIDTAVQRAVAGSPTGASESAAARCAQAVSAAAAAAVKAEAEAVRARLAEDTARIDEAAARDRESCAAALGALLVKHDLPETTSSFALALADGARYAARLAGTTRYGLAATLELEVPAAHLFGHPLRLDKVVERLEVEAPEESGWLQKKVRLRGQRLEKHWLSGADFRPEGDVLRLRADADGGGGGFDVALGGPERPRLIRVGEGLTPEPFEVSEADAPKLRELRDKLAAAAAELHGQRKALVEATLDGKPVGLLAAPLQLAERVVIALAPTVQEIARHSLTPTELVLKRLLADDRREEIFVSKAELARKLEQLPEGRRALFEPLGLLAPAAAHDAPPTAPKVAAAEVSSPGIPVDERAIVIEADPEDEPPAPRPPPPPPLPKPTGSAA